MKFISIVCLLLVSFSLQNQIGLAGRDFLTGLLTSIKGPEFHLEENCLGADFDKDCVSFMEAINKKDLILIPAYFGKITNDIHKNCPTSDLAQILKDTMAGGPIELYKKIHAHSLEVLSIIKDELFGKKLTPKNIGEATGRVIELVIYSKTESYAQLGFLSVDSIVESFSTWSVEQFVDGFFEGVSNGPIAENKCFSDILAVKGDIVIAVTDIINAFKNKNIGDILPAIEKLINVVLKVKDSAVNCNFVKLAASLASLGTKIGIAKLGMTVVTHISATIGDIKDLSSAIITKDSEKTGVAIGHLFKLLLNYSTN